MFVLNRLSREKKVTISGLPRDREMNIQLWNADGKGTLSPSSIVHTDHNGTATLSVPHMAVARLSPH